MNKTRLLLGIAAFAIIGVVVFQRVAWPAQVKIAWSPARLDQSLSVGGSATINVSFTSDQPLENVTLEAVPEIARFVQIQPSSFAQVAAGQPQTVQLTFSVPAGTPIRAYDGTIHVREGKRTVPQPLKVSVTVTPPGVQLPPDPGEAGRATIEGIDSDRDGVRDDIQRYIALTYPNSAKARSALTQAAVVLEEVVTGGANAEQLDRAIDCISYTFMTGDADVAGGKIALDNYRSLKETILNTPARVKAFYQWDSRLGATTSFSTPHSQQAARCTINPSTHPN